MADHIKGRSAAAPKMISADQLLLPVVGRLVSKFSTLADETLSSKHITDKDRDLLSGAKRDIEQGAQLLLEVITRADTASQVQALTGFRRALGAAWRIGASGAITGTGVGIAREIAAAHARSVRASSTKEKDLMRFIAGAIRGRDLTKPHALAGSIAPKINSQLTARGHKPVGVDAIYKRIKKASC